MMVTSKRYWAVGGYTKRGKRVQLEMAVGRWMLDAGGSCSDSEAPVRGLKYLLGYTVVE